MGTWTQTSDSPLETPGLLIAGGNGELCKGMAKIFGEADYRVTVAGSAAETIANVMEGTTPVVLIVNELDGCRAGELVPLLKQCDPEICIILVCGDAPVPLLRKLRREGIFYHALQPLDADGVQEIREAVRCAFASHPALRWAAQGDFGDESVHAEKERRAE